MGDIQEQDNNMTSTEENNMESGQEKTIDKKDTNIPPIKEKKSVNRNQVDNFNLIIANL